MVLSDRNEVEESDKKRSPLDKVPSSSPIIWKLLIPLLLTALILIASFSVLLWWQQDQQIEEGIQKTIDLVQNDYETTLEKQSSKMVTELNWIAVNEPLIDALEKQDPDTLLLNSQNLYDRLSQVHNISHFYYQGPDRVNVLRVHMPDKRGGSIERFTLLEAERTGNVVTGLELGSLGFFTLWAIKPVYSNGTLIGYIELGKEIEDILNSISENTGAELTVFIYKDSLDRNNWENGMLKLDREADWDRYSSKVIIYGTVPLSTAFEQPIELEEAITKGNSLEIVDNETIWHTSSMTLNDASGDEVGFMLIRQDITAERNLFAENLKRLIIRSILLFVLLCSFYFFMLKRTAQSIFENEFIVKESSDRFRSVIESAHDAVMIVNSKGKIVYWNKRAESIFGYDRDETIGAHLLTFIPERYREAHKNKFNGSDITGLTVQIEGLKKDGSEIPIELSLSSWNSKHGRYYGGVIRDITKRKEDEDMLKKYAAELERSNELKTIFADIMRHDLMNPISFINGYVGVLLETEKDPDKVTKIKCLKKVTSKLIIMIEEASKFSMLEESDEITLKVFDLEFMLRSSAMYIQKQADEKEMSIELDLHGPYFVKADPMVEDVFANILSNAIKYSPKRTKVIVDVANQGEFWKISITDSGEGIADEDKPLVFDRFKRVNKGNIKGTGLGLAIVKRIMELHEGDVGVSNNPEGQGSVFWVTLKKADL
ncbi:PAS domain S-box protein [Methanococcoides alaskense]|uniref:histidine kinase n=1 Tax=Methanococcoides alaskense TaxID=325778 RepID=A0AA90U0R2_9EURY|nr:PAS domain S-box protein [Methanococcoides alaskense]MDA0524322.1 PAS domain S-box protein [Methanococcoides alaskense]MDR6223725.1 PAS domain S-box-containing protein [Methanococcoides alaskense]